MYNRSRPVPKLCIVTDTLAVVIWFQIFTYYRNNYLPSCATLSHDNLVLLLGKTDKICRAEYYGNKVHFVPFKNWTTKSDIPNFLALLPRPHAIC
ncbi:hypothetical protein BGX38DRAFT_1230286 [Terfezia claveryi]|nr:hypothetical protein BGX38DRAFT_1230286 [Terfezia claveryi]